MEKGTESAAVGLLKRAVELDEKGQAPEEARTLYQEGASLLLTMAKATTDVEKRARLRKQVEQYIQRAEQLKELEQIRSEAAKHEQIHIAADSRGHSYERLLGRFIEEGLTSVEVEDPYIRSSHQLYNFLRFCELLVKKASSLRRILLITGSDERMVDAQKEKLESIQRSLQKYNVQLTVQFSDTLHDREIRLDTGWVIKIGRGLDIYKPVDQFSIGFCDYDLRPCHETTIDIFHRKFVKNRTPGSPAKKEN